ncbi:hypothetical protein GCM10011505_47590 [Tistrella bauzanensis]|uniref:TRAP transporter small permease protein n=1 Tax=Tistrella bauzanensis TaxID=657419 RepID=A0ABQ1J7E1_9PROT|nr:TRAP transporter small permease subunit [Tistrella bauzanensis]GGB61412.1 hypothetical protein GCM10011505_47590 [Tistrella bauzanensis]
MTDEATSSGPGSPRSGPPGLRLIDITGWLGAVAILLMAVHVCIDVLARNLADMPLTGTTEVVSYWYMVAIVFCTLGGVQARNAHIRVDLVNIAIGRWRSAARIDGVLSAMTALLFLAACLGLMLYTADQALTATLRAERVEFTSHALPVWPGRWLVPLGFALTGWVSASDLARAIRLIITGHVPAAQGAR